MDEAELLFTQILNCNRLDLYLNRERLLDKKNSELISRVLRRRVAGCPIQHILGKTEFMGLGFKVSPDVFIPRPETEILVETAINVTTSQPHNLTSVKILDIGTGSGCIAVSLAKLLPNAEVTATEVSALALGVAKENADLNNVKVNFIESNLFSAACLQNATFDLIVSNPPYIPTLAIKNLQREIKYEPRVALDGGSDGLNFYRRIIAGAPAYLKDDANLILEIGFLQRRGVEKIAQALKELSLSEIIRDYNDIERVIVFKKNRS